MAYDAALSRRTILSGLAVAPALSMLPACRAPGDNGTADLPDCRNPASNGDVIWTPDVAHPVSWGAVNVGPEVAAPRPMMIYYPAARDTGSLGTDIRAPAPAPATAGQSGQNSGREGLRVTPYRTQQMLKMCGRRWPVVLFLHGNVEDRIKPTHYRSWRLLPASLAKAGFVVIVPSHRASPQPNDADLAAALLDVAWVRTQWANAQWVDQGPQIALSAHSNGCYSAIRLAEQLPQLASITLLGTQNLYQSDYTYGKTLSELQASQFLFYSKNISIERQVEGWTQVPAPTVHLAGYDGGHFDYLPRSAVPDYPYPAGPCAQFGQVAADLVTLFVSRSLGPFRNVAPELVRPVVTLSAAQQRYAARFLTGIGDVACAPGCRIDLSWKVSGIEGMRRIGPTSNAPVPCAQS